MLGETEAKNFQELSDEFSLLKMLTKCYQKNNSTRKKFKFRNLRVKLQTMKDKK